MAIKLADEKTPSGAAAPSIHRIFGPHAEWEERVVTVVATTIAVMIVAAVAILMGMV